MVNRLEDDGMVGRVVEQAGDSECMIPLHSERKPERGSTDILESAHGVLNQDMVAQKAGGVTRSTIHGIEFAVGIREKGDNNDTIIQLS